MVQSDSLNSCRAFLFQQIQVSALWSKIKNTEVYQLQLPTKLYQAYSAKGKNPVVDLKTMFKISSYAYSQNIYSTHKIEIACKRDINFMWILTGRKAPDHSTIAHFRQKNVAVAIEDPFYQLVNIHYELNELKFENIFIEDTKIKAHANCYTFVQKKVIVKNGAKYTDEGIEFIHGSGKRPKKLQKQYESVMEYLKRQKAYNDSKNKFDGKIVSQKQIQTLLLCI